MNILQMTILAGSPGGFLPNMYPGMVATTLARVIRTSAGGSWAGIEVLTRYPAGHMVVPSGRSTSAVGSCCHFLCSSADTDMSRPSCKLPLLLTGGVPWPWPETGWRPEKKASRDMTLTPAQPGGTDEIVANVQ